ncbi:hypothetical protein KAU11_06725, partial [Candidatus Babeliales bacterium]|nr:hypothetical protein [Candidatus Babeliales bacterium]
WEEAVNASYYQIKVSVDGAASTTIGYPTSNKFLHDNLPSGHTYAYEVITVNSYDQVPTGAVPSEAKTTLTITAPLEPKNLVVSLRSDTLKMGFTLTELEYRHKRFEIIRKSVGFTDNFPNLDPLNTYYWTNLSDVLTNVDATLDSNYLRMYNDTTISANTRYLHDSSDITLYYTDTYGYLIFGLTDPRDTREIASDETGSYISVQTKATTIEITYRKNWESPVVITPIAYTPGTHILQIVRTHDSITINLDTTPIYTLSSSDTVPDSFLTPFIKCWYTTGGTPYLKIASFISSPNTDPLVILSTSKQTLSFPLLFPGGDYLIRNQHVLDEYQDSDSFPIDANSIIAPIINSVDRIEGDSNIKINYELLDYFTQSSHRIEVWISQYATTGFSLITTVSATGLAIPVKIPVGYKLNELDCYVYIKKISPFDITSQKSNTINADFPTMQSAPNIPVDINLYLNSVGHYVVNWFFDKYNNSYEPLTRPPISFKIYEDIDGGGYSHIYTTYNNKQILYTLPTGHTYSYKARSVDRDGNESADSVVVSITI